MTIKKIDITAPPNSLFQGISICRSIIEAHSGTIAAENKDEGGSRFYFELPLDSMQYS